MNGADYGLCNCLKNQLQRRSGAATTPHWQCSSATAAFCFGNSSGVRRPWFTMYLDIALAFEWFRDLGESFWKWLRPAIHMSVHSIRQPSIPLSVIHRFNSPSIIHSITHLSITPPCIRPSCIHPSVDFYLPTFIPPYHHRLCLV